MLGWDAAGTVAGVGSLVNGFDVGDRVYYAGEFQRPGTNAQFNLVDARVVSKAPKTLSDLEAAALPLTTLTAWEMLFDRMDVTRAVKGAYPAIMLIGAAGGVGSVAIQLLRAKTDLTVIATASRPETNDWCRELGAHHVLDHNKPLPVQLRSLGIPDVSFVFSMANTDGNRDQIVEMLAPQGRFGFIDNPLPLDIGPFYVKSLSIHTESIFTRPTFGTADIASQGEILAAVAELVDAGKVRTTLSKVGGQLSVETLREAHRLLESGKSYGKIALSGI